VVFERARQRQRVLRFDHAAPVAPARARDTGFFEEQEYRLRTLKRLCGSGLISEEEYQKERTEILDKLRTRELAGGRWGVDFG
jgi:hypothetical protein